MIELTTAYSICTFSLAVEKGSESGSPTTSPLTSDLTKRAAEGNGEG
jgi:hypothetical protein